LTRFTKTKKTSRSRNDHVASSEWSPLGVASWASCRGDFVYFDHSIPGAVSFPDSGSVPELGGEEVV
jgi:hypothetical protein